jgi:molybdopterin-guanine dinucleotide biosynthesis protein A
VVGQTDPVEFPFRSAIAPWAAVILAGGTSRRWGGADKTAFPLAGTPLLVHAVSSVLPGAAALAIVAPADHPARTAVLAAAAAARRPVTWTRENPPGGGPAAGLAAGLAALTAPPEPPPASAGAGAITLPQAGAIAVLAGDLPFARTAWPRLLAALAAEPGADAAVGLDPHGRRQPLLAVYRVDALGTRLDAAGGAGRPLRDVTAGMLIIDVPVTRIESLDLDTPQDAEAASRHAASGHESRTCGEPRIQRRSGSEE